MDETYRLLNDYITVRNTHLDEIFNLFVRQLVTHKKYGYPLRVDKKEPGDPKLDLIWQHHFDNLVDMMLIIQNNDGPTTCGLGVVSYCQTWLRKGPDQELTSNFSVMSPHFQTRFYVNDPKLLCYVPEIQMKHLESYNILIKRFDGLLNDEYGGVKGQAFIHLDNLLLFMN